MKKVLSSIRWVGAYFAVRNGMIAVNLLNTSVQ